MTRGTTPRSVTDPAPAVAGAGPGVDPEPGGPTPAGAADPGSRRRQWLRQDVILLVLLLVMILVFSLINSSFITRFNLFSTLQDATEFAPLAVAELFVLITGGVDLSVGSVLGLAGVLAAMVARKIGGDGYAALVLAGFTAVGVGLVCGLANALMIVKVRISPFVATLATLGVAGGLTLVVTNAVDVTPVPALASQAGNTAYLGFFSVPIIVCIVLAIVAGVVLHQTVFGRWTYAVGSNGTVARECGINVSRQLFSVYALSGVLAGLAGFLVLLRLGIGSPSEGTNDELNAIVGVVIGGASLFGGRGSMLGAMIGTLMLSVILSGLIIVGVQPYWQTVATGVLLAVAVSFQTIGPARGLGGDAR